MSVRSNCIRFLVFDANQFETTKDWWHSPSAALQADQIFLGLLKEVHLLGNSPLFILLKMASSSLDRSVSYMGCLSGQSKNGVIYFLILQFMMDSLDHISAGILEQTIDRYIEAIPSLIPDYRKEEEKKRLMYDNVDDFALGLAIGMITAHFEDAFMTCNHRQLNFRERAAVMSILYLRMPQIKEALYKSE